MENQTQVTPIIQPEPQIVKNNNFLVILLSILLVISVAIFGFFAFQNQKLVKELTLLRSELIPTVTAEPTIEPTISISTTPPPTLHWKTYINTSSTYQIKYPVDWKVVNQSAGSMGLADADARYIEIGLGEGKSGTIGIEELQIIPPSEEVNLNTTKVIGDLTLRCNGNFTTDTKAWCWVKVPNQEKYLNIQFFKNSNVEMNSILDQILSTFKFIN